MVGTLGIEPSQEHPSDAKGFINASRVPTPAPITFMTLSLFETSASDQL
jgi:hypothetical protein